MRYLYFDTSRIIYEQLTEIFDFVWPTATGMWNLRWQVQGYVLANPETTVKELEGRFVAGSKIHGANLQRACIEHDWEKQQEQFAKFLLTNLCALYEAWIKQVMESLSVSDENIGKQLQFPTTINANGVRKGVWSTIDGLTSTKSTFLTGFYSALSSHPKNSRDKIDDILKCYRFFKESRNCLVHHGGIASDHLLSVYTEFLSVATPEQLGVKEVPVYHPVITGQPIKLSLRGVVGLGDIILKIITTLDAELSQSIYAELEFEKRWRNKHANKYTLKADGTPEKLAAKERQLRRLVSGLGFPSPSETSEIESFLRNKGLVQ